MNDEVQEDYTDENGNTDSPPISNKYLNSLEMQFCTLEAEIASLKTMLNRLEKTLSNQIRETSDVLEWVRSAQAGSKFVKNILSWSSKGLILIAKIVAAIAIVWAFFSAVRNGKLPDIHLPP